MLEVKTKELKISDKLKNKLEMICKFAGVKAEYYNGSIRNILKTNIAYVEPHRVVINNKSYLVFDNCDKVYLENLKTSIPLSELEQHLKTTI